MKSYYLIILLIYILSIARVALAQPINIRYVSGTGTNTVPSSATSWATSTSDLQGAINSLTATGGQVWVAAGLYKPGGDANTDRAVSFSMTSGIDLYGGFMGNEITLTERQLTIPSSTTLSGDIGVEDDSTDNSYHVLFFVSYRGTETQTGIDGFVITQGRADGPLDGVHSKGGGMYMDDTQYPVLNNCSFVHNSASDLGGGLFSLRNQVRLINCNFTDNSADMGGGGLVINSQQPIINCSFIRNSSKSIAGAIAAFINGLFLINSTFVSNSSPDGPIYVSGEHYLINCILWNNGYSSRLFTLANISYSFLDPSLQGRGGRGNIITSYFPFINDHDFRLNACSPAINAGTTTVRTDLDGLGSNRVVGDRIDMGAFEFQGTPQGMYTISPGLWTDPAIWSCGRVPLPTDSVWLKHVVSLPSNYQAQAMQVRYDIGQQLLFDTGSQLTINQ
ncbi:choice-of-anchor Q domain-containing protein [Spirosoma gilvum]